jgi:hypothetical protein
MEITQQEVSKILQDLDDCVFHLRKYAELSHVPQHLKKNSTRSREAICFLADEVETWCEEHQHDDEEDLNFGFNDLMDAEIMGMLK